MSDQVQAEEIIDQDDANQIEATDDFFSDDEEIIDQDSGEIIGSEKEVTEQDQKPLPPKPEEAKAGEKPNENEGEQQEQFKRPDGVAGDFFGENGEMDLEKLAGFTGIKDKPFSYERPKVEGGEQQQQSNEPPKPFHVERREQYRDERNTIQKNLNDALETFYNYLPADQNRDVAYNGAVQALNVKLSATFQEMEDKMHDDIYNHQSTSSSESQEIKKLEPQAQTNQGIVAQRLGGYEKFNQLFTDPHSGGAVLQALFDMASPDHSGLQGDSFSKSFNNWFTKFSSNMNHMELATRMSQSMLLSNPTVYNELVKKIRASKDGQVQNLKKATSQKSTGISTPKGNNGSQASNELNTFLNGIGGEVFEL